MRSNRYAFFPAVLVPNFLLSNGQLVVAGGISVQTYRNRTKRDELLDRIGCPIGNSLAMRCVALWMMISRAILNLERLAKSRFAGRIGNFAVSAIQCDARGVTDQNGLTRAEYGFCTVQRSGTSPLQRKIIPRRDESPGHLTRRAE